MVNGLWQPRPQGVPKQAHPLAVSTTRMLRLLSCGAPSAPSAGMDVTRKVITLARECGANVEMRDINTESLIPEPLRAGILPQEFYDRLPQVS